MQIQVQFWAGDVSSATQIGKEILEELSPADRKPLP